MSQEGREYSFERQGASIGSDRPSRDIGVNEAAAIKPPFDPKSTNRNRGQLPLL